MEAASLNTSFYKEALIVLGAAAIVVPLFHRLRVSSVLGFMLVGIVVGPFGLASLAPHLPWLSVITIGPAELIEPIAGLGVVLLLFMIGLELSFERLWVMRRLVFGLGALQVMLCAAVLAGAAILLGHGRTTAVVIGLTLAMSSTAVVIQVLSEEKRLNTVAGRASVAILLFQDLAVVPVLLVLGALGRTHHGGSAVGFSLAVGQALLTVAGIVALGRLVLRPLFRSVARTRRPELFMAACLLVVIATGLATTAAGLSMALGALIGGLLLAVTEYRRQVEVTIEPFKGLFVGVFLISIGMSLDIRTVAAHPILVFGTAGGMVLLKLLVIAPLMRGFSLSWATGLHTGLLLGPGGEFAFVIVSVALGERLLAPDTAGVMLFVTALTMAGIPMLSRLGNRLAPRHAAGTPITSRMLVPEVSDLQPRVIIAGFGRVGQTVAEMLEVHNVPYVAIDRDPDRVARQRAAMAKWPQPPGPAVTAVGATRGRGAARCRRRLRNPRLATARTGAAPSAARAPDACCSPPASPRAAQHEPRAAAAAEPGARSETRSTNLGSPSAPSAARASTPGQSGESASYQPRTPV